VIVAAVMAGVAVMSFARPASSLWSAYVAGAAAIAAVSWLDDLRGVGSAVRLAVHFAAAVPLAWLAAPVVVHLPGFDSGVARFLGFLMAVLWLVWLTNAYNFMDGIDALAGGQAVVAGVALAVAAGHDGDLWLAVLPGIIAAASAGFLTQNWPPARIFMGDVGSAFLGYSFAAFGLIGAASSRAIVSLTALALWPFLFDTAFTLVGRARRGENLLEAHRGHLYQRLVRAGYSHEAVTVSYLTLSVGGALLGLGISFGWPGADVAAAVVVMAAPRRRGGEGVRNRYLLLADLVLIVLSAFGSFVLRLDWFFQEYQQEFRFFLAAALVVKPPVFFWFGLYSRYWRYASLRDLLAVVLGVSAAALVLAAVTLAALWTGADMSMPRSVMFIDWILSLLAVAGIRASVRMVSEVVDRKGESAQGGERRVLVVGAGDAGVMVVREMARNPQLGMTPVGFLDDDPAKQGKRVQNIPVLGRLSDLRRAAVRCGASELVIAMPRVGGAVVRRLSEECRRAGLSARVLPGVYELLDGHVSVSRLRNVEITDLLRRPPVLGPADAAAYLSDRVVLVTGAGGSIGTELCRQAAGAGASELVLLGHGENSIFEVEARLKQETHGVRLVPVIVDVRDRQRLAAIFTRHRPAVVFHAAAHKHVPLMEANPQEAVTNNVLGTRNVVEAAMTTNVERFVLISTDKAVAPSSVMGATKRVAEALVRQAGRRSGRPFVVVRFGNVLGSRGSVVPSFKQQIERGGPVTVTHPDIARFFMTIPEAIHLVLEAGGKGSGGDLFVLNMGQPVRIVDLARDLIRLSGYAADEIPIVFSGLRPGEKLHEVLWDDGSRAEPTDNPEILRVIDPDEQDRNLLAFVDELSRAAHVGDEQSIRRLLLGGAFERKL
jgi:FlaA1/EpsC-like NDP-sugar epimerase/UDP-N-acetylmuramyl pentapeptide phosphotransferase/UDP-N-acetylglucosamine-1-phosphate transferase